MTKKSPNNNKLITNIVVALSVIALFAVLAGIGGNALPSSKSEKTYSEFLSDIKTGKIAKVTFNFSGDKVIAGLYSEGKDRTKTKEQKYDFFKGGNLSDPLTTLKNSIEADGSKLIIGTGENQIEIAKEKQGWAESALADGTITNFVFLAIVIFSAFLVIKKLGDSNGKAMTFGNSKGKFYDDGTAKKITFAEVAGQLEAKTELMEVVDFLKRPKNYTEMGAKIPRGVLLSGGPGNGKTLMAKAVAGEAGVPFIFVSGSEFVEMFVGVGASRVRDLFKSAKKQAPAVIFIDEIDAVGRQRGIGMGGGNDEREQTLNQILVEMDGFETNESVIVIAATNRPDVLDPALLRPGRFDRQVTVTSPDKRERKQILQVHTKDKKMADDVDFDIIAKRTPGFSGADLMNVLNESAILAVRHDKKQIDNECVREAIERVALGPALKSKVVSEKDRMLTAYHEAGHAIVATVLPNAKKVQKITIIPRGRAGGYTFSVDDNDSMGMRYSEFLDEITVLYGGYVAEVLIFGEVSTGPSNDLARITEMARNMITKYGMSRLGALSLDKDKGMGYLGRDMMESKSYSEDMARQIDSETQRIIGECKTKCEEIMVKYRPYLEQIAQNLLENEVLEFEEFEKIVAPIKVIKK